MKVTALMLSTLLVLAGCSSAGPLTATSNKVAHSKGEACKRDILFFIPLSTDNSIYSAAKEGRISKISTVDQHSFISIFYNTHCTVVRGSKDESEPKVEVKVEKVVEESAKPKVEGIEDSGLKMIEDSQVKTPEELAPLIED